LDRLDHRSRHLRYGFWQRGSSISLLTALLGALVILEGFFIFQLQHDRTSQHRLNGNASMATTPEQSMLGSAWQGGSESRSGPSLTDSPNADGKLNLLTNHAIRERVAYWERAPNGSALPSTRLAPLRISSCAEHMPYHW
jgi:hypothetical protein